MKHVLTHVWRILWYALMGGGLWHVLAPYQYHWLDAWQITTAIVLALIGLAGYAAMRWAKENP